MTPRQQLKAMLSRYDPAVAAVARGALTRLQRLMPGAVRLIYDNAYALVIGFGATERASEAVLSVVVYPRHVAVCFLWGVDLPDPEKRLQGGGRQVRHIRLGAASDLDAPVVRRLLRAAIEASESPFRSRGGAIQVRANSGKRRPRRPGAGFKGRRRSGPA